MVIKEEQYAIVAAERQTYNQLIWQTPVLSLTAQAFLLTIALGPDSSVAARLISSSLSLVAAVASYQLFIKHRFFERSFSKELQRFEEENEEEGWKILHDRRPRPDEDASRLERVRSYRWWLLVLFLFAAAAAAVLSMVLVRPRWLDPVPSAVDVKLHTMTQVQQQQIGHQAAEIAKLRTTAQRQTERISQMEKRMSNLTRPRSRTSQ